MQDIGLERFELTWYEKKGDKFIGETVLKEVDLDQLRNLLNIPPNEPIVYVYPVNEIHANFLQEVTDVKIDLDKYDYFIESSAESLKEGK